MLRPVQIGPPGIDLHHGDAVRHRADMLAEITADAFLVNHAVLPLAVDPERGNGLVGGILARDMAEAAFDAEILVDCGDDLVVHVEVLPVRDIGHRLAAEILDPGIALAVHPVRQPVDHVVDDLEAVMHGGGADLHRAGAERHELRRVAPAGDAADGRDGHAVGRGIPGDLRHHMQRDGLHRRAAIAAMGALAVHGGGRGHLVEID